MYLCVGLLQQYECRARLPAAQYTVLCQPHSSLLPFLCLLPLF